MSDNIAFEKTSYDGQVVIVTGAASGIGKSAAELIASRGAKVVCVDLNQLGVDQTVTSILNLGGKAESAVLDISNQKGITDFISQTVGKDKRIDALINCAGYPGPTGKFVEEINWDDFQKVVAVCSGRIDCG
ncbi:MAG: hypothetical protein RI992_243 [Actinomycetota bacterium]